MKKIFLLFFFTSLCFSQNDNPSSKKIDSIIKTIRPFEQISGVIKDQRKVIGGFGITTYKFENKLIKGLYIEKTETNKEKLSLFFEYYYEDGMPFFLNIQISKTDKNKRNEEFNVSLNKNEIEDYKEIKNIFFIDLRKKIDTVNLEIQNYANSN
jgi:hypothetical protein